MLEFTLTFAVTAIFFLVLYFKVKTEHIERSDAETTLSRIDGFLKTACLGIAFVSLFLAFGFSALGDPQQTVTTNNTYSNVSTGVGLITPVVSSYTETITTTLTNAQFVFINAAAQLITILMTIYIVMLFVNAMIKGVKTQIDFWRKKKEGDYEA